MMNFKIKFFTNLLFVIMITMLTKTYAQEGINVSLGSGTTLVRGEIGYTFLKKINVGLYYGPSFMNISPRSYGVSGRYYGKTNEIGSSFFQFSSRGYLGANLGLISNEETTELGYSGNLGVDLLYGKRGGFGTFFEVNIGNSPNYFNSMMSSFDLDNSDNSSEKLGSLFGFMFGFRFYI